MQSLRISQKQALRLSVRQWCAVLEASGSELEKKLSEAALENPFLKFRRKSLPTFSSGDFIENSPKERFLQESLLDQIDSSFFPTEFSQKIAAKIIEELNVEGYFEGDESAIAEEFGTSEVEVEKIRKRFRKLDPCGVGAKDSLEAFEFRLLESDYDEDLSSLAYEILRSPGQIHHLQGQARLLEAIDLAKRFSAPPALEFMQGEAFRRPDILVAEDEGVFRIEVWGDEFELGVEACGVKEKNSLKKEARLLCDYFNMRHSTLRKIATLIVDLQRDFFQGGELRPFSVSQAALEIGISQPTFSRAIAQKSLCCSRGTFPLRKFFPYEAKNGVSGEEIRAFIKALIAQEQGGRIYSDEELSELVKRKFGVHIVRRTIGKYREQLGIPSPNFRKKLQGLKVKSLAVS